MDFDILIGIFPQVLLDGIILGFMYALIALGYTMVYGIVKGHNGEIKVHPGQKVDTTTVLALSGNTGHSTGPHVHYEVWKNGQSVHPKPFIEARN